MPVDGCPMSGLIYKQNGGKYNYTIKFNIL